MTVETMDEKDDENCLLLEWQLPFFQTHRHQLTKERRKFVRTRLETLRDNKSANNISNLSFSKFQQTPNYLLTRDKPLFSYSDILGNW